MRKPALALVLLLSLPVVSAHAPSTPWRSGGLPASELIEQQLELPVEVGEALTARFIVDGLIKGYSWQSVECTDEVVLASQQGSQSFSFCFRHLSTTPDTLIELEQILRNHREQWEEVGWTEVHEALGGVYRSRSERARYLIVIIGGYHQQDGYTDVILSVADRQ